MTMAAVQVDGLGKRYGERVALRDFCLELSFGTSLAAVGGNGAGKTTALKLLAGLLGADQGQGKVLGMDLLRNRAAIRSQVGYMSQHYALYLTLTAWENLFGRAQLYCLPQPARVAEGLLERFQLGPYRTTRAGALSGGWMRRLQLACSLVASPTLLILDEPTAGLDILSRKSMWEIIHSQCQEGVAVVVSTHDLDEVHACSQVALFLDGCIVAQSAPQHLLRDSGWKVFAAEPALAELPSNHCHPFRDSQGNPRVLVRADQEKLKSTDSQPLQVGVQDALLALTSVLSARQTS